MTPKGGHLGWVAGGEAPIGAPWTDTIVMEFLRHLERGEASKLHASSIKSEATGQSSDKMQFAEV